MDRRSITRLSVLIADDDDAMRGTVVDALSDRGFRVFTARQGDEALKILLCESIDFSILDVEMPRLTGIEVVRRYLAGSWIAPPSGRPERGPSRRMPTIFMSANPSLEIRTDCEAVGVTFLDKPFAPRQLRSAVDRLVAHDLIA